MIEVVVMALTIFSSLLIRVEVSTCWDAMVSFGLFRDEWTDKIVRRLRNGVEGSSRRAPLSAMQSQHIAQSHSSLGLVKPSLSESHLRKCEAPHCKRQDVVD